MLRAVEADLLAATRYSHRNHFVGNPVEQIRHHESIGKHYSYHQNVVEQKLPVAYDFRVILGEIAVGEYAGKNSADDAAEAMGGEYIQSIVECLT